MQSAAVKQARGKTTARKRSSLCGSRDRNPVHSAGARTIGPLPASALYIFLAVKGRPVAAKATAGAASNDKTPFYCNGCGLTYSRDGRKVPCEQNCVFAEHAEHNKNYKTGTPWPHGKPKLTWGTPEEYKRKYGVEMPARGQQYLEMRAKFKRKREEGRTSNA